MTTQKTTITTKAPGLTGTVTPRTPITDRLVAEAENAWREACTNEGIAPQAAPSTLLIEAIKVLTRSQGFSRDTLLALLHEHPDWIDAPLVGFTIRRLLVLRLRDHMMEEVKAKIMHLPAIAPQLTEPAPAGTEGAASEQGSARYPEARAYPRTAAHDAYFSEEVQAIYRQLPTGELQARAAMALEQAADIQQARFGYLIASMELLRRGIPLA